jgi:antitoxin component of MazEF toxin-antitoxin module
MKNKIKSYEAVIHPRESDDRGNSDDFAMIELPIELLDQLGWNEYNELKWTVTNNAVILTRITDVL